MSHLSSITEEGGYLELIIGPMFSGKTSRLVEIYNHHNKNTENRVLTINYIGDKRYHDVFFE